MVIDTGCANRLYNGREILSKVRKQNKKESISHSFQFLFAKV